MISPTPTPNLSVTPTAPPAAASSPPPDHEPASGPAPTPRTVTRRRPRKASRTRQMFLQAIQAQITSTRILAVLTFVVLLASAAVWLIATTGSPVIGLYFVALAAVLGFTVYWFLQVMGMFIGRR